MPGFGSQLVAQLPTENPHTPDPKISGNVLSPHHSLPFSGSNEQ